MSKKKINLLALCEGATEKTIIDKLKKIHDHTIKASDLGGEGNLSPRLEEEIDTLIEDIKVNPDTITGILVFLDQDNKKIDDRCKKVLATVQKKDKNAQFEKASHDNVFILKTTLSNLRLVLHVSTHRCEPASIGRTADDYVLSLALTQTIASHLLKEDKTKKADWTLTPDNLIIQIREKIPELLKTDGVKSLSAKQCLRLYAAVVAPKKSIPAFAGIVLDYSTDSDIRNVFASLIKAIEHLGNEL